ncbi:MAG: hypothetical protein J0L75_00625 [Spirochaetes bacterium]|nr:hypothetical protein [Spirochaetota bacterium]
MHQIQLGQWRRILLGILAFSSPLLAQLHHGMPRVGALGPAPMKAADFSAAVDLVATNLPPQWRFLSMTESWSLTNPTLRVEGLMAMDRKQDSPFLNLNAVTLSRWGSGGRLLREEMSITGVSLTPWALAALRDGLRGKTGVEVWGPLVEEFMGGTLAFHSAVALTPLTGTLRYELLRLEYGSHAFLELDARIVGCRDPDLGRAARRLVTNLPNYGKLLKGNFPPGVPQPREVNLRAEGKWTNLNLAAYLDRFDQAQVVLVRDHPALPARFRVEASARGALKVLDLSLTLERARLEVAPFGRADLQFQARYFIAGTNIGLGLTGFRLKLEDGGAGTWGWKILATLFRTNERDARVQAVAFLKRQKAFDKIPAAWQGPLLRLFTVEQRSLVFRLRDRVVLPLRKKGGVKDVTKFISVE